MIDIEEFSRSFSRWVADLCELSGDKIISIDGKCLRRSMDAASNKAAIYMVSAWASSNQLVLGKQRVDDKSDEITAIPKLLMQLDISGAVVTLNAMGCQTKIANEIIKRDADYMLSLKGNQGLLHKDVALLKQTSPEAGFESIDGGYGRLEKRSVRAV